MAGFAVPNAASSGCGALAAVRTVGAHARPTLAGRMVVPATACQYPPAIQSTDLLEVDFDAKNPTDGLYLVEELSPKGVEWRGCRRFQRTPDGLAIDESGGGAWRYIASPQSCGIRVVGRICQVYRATIG